MIYINVDVHGKVLKINGNLINTEFDCMNGIYLYYVTGWDEKGEYCVLFSSPDVEAAWKMFERYKLLVQIQQNLEDLKNA